MDGRPSQLAKDGAVGISKGMKVMIAQVLEQQKHFNADLTVSLKTFAKTKASSMDDYAGTIILTSTGEGEHLTESIIEIKEIIITYGEYWRKNVPKVTRATLTINSLLSGPWRNFTILELASSLARAANLCSAFKGDEDAMWICIAIHRLQLQLLQYISYEVMRGAKLPGAAKDLSVVLDSLYNTTESTGLVSGMMVQEAAKSLSSMLVDNTKSFGLAAMDIIVGGAKSVLTMKVDEQLLAGLQRGVVAGFELFKHCSAAEQFRVIQQLDPTRELVQPLASYEQLLLASRTMEATNGNWLLTATYANNLMKVAYCALRNVGSANSSAADNDLCLKLLQACVTGDGAVVSLSGLLKNTRRKRRTSAMDVLGNAMLNGETLTGVLRSIVMEAMGERMESVENFSLGKLDVVKSLTAAAQKGIESTRTMAGKLVSGAAAAGGTVVETAQKAVSQIASKAGQIVSKASATSGAVVNAAEKSVLQVMTQLCDALQEVHKWIKLFEKSIAKVVVHIKGLLVSIDALLKYWDMFQGKLSDGHLQSVVLSLYKQTEATVSEVTGAARAVVSAGETAKLSYVAMSQRLETGVSVANIDAAGAAVSAVVSDGAGAAAAAVDPTSENSNKLSPNASGVTAVDEAQHQLRVMVELGRKHLASSVEVLEKMLSSFRVGATVSSLADELQKLVDQETQRQHKIEHPKSSFSLNWFSGGGGDSKGGAVDLTAVAFQTKAEVLLETVNTMVGKAVADAFASNLKGLASQNEVFQFFLEVVSKVEDMFFDLSECKDLVSAAGNLLRKDAEQLAGKIENLVTAQLGRLKDIVVGSVLSGSWFNTVADAWGTCAASPGAMGMLREGVQLLIGPGACPERVEEASMVAVLELDALVTMVVQMRASDSLTKEQSDQLLSVQKKLMLHIAQAKATSKHAIVQTLLGQSKYRSKVADVLRKSWQTIEEGVMQEHTANLVAQEALSVAVVKDDQLGSHMGSCDAIPQLIKSNSFQRSVEYTEQAVRELLPGQGGISGLAPGLLRTLHNIKRALQKSEERTLDLVTAAAEGANKANPPPSYSYDTTTPANLSSESGLGALAPLLAEVMPLSAERDSLLAAIHTAESAVGDPLASRLSARLDIIGRAVAYLAVNETHLWVSSEVNPAKADTTAADAHGASLQLILARMAECESQLNQINELKVQCNGVICSEIKPSNKQVINNRLDALLNSAKHIPNPLRMKCTERRALCPHCDASLPQSMIGDHILQCAKRPAPELPQTPQQVQCKECGKTMNPGDLSYHMDAWHKSVVCPHCDASIPEPNLQDHVSQCPSAPVKCDECHKAIKRGDLTEHHATVHPPVPCEHCGETLPRSQQLRHHTTECPKVSVHCQECDKWMERQYIADHERTEMHLRSVRAFEKTQEMLNKKIADGRARKAKYDKMNAQNSVSAPRPAKPALTAEQIAAERQRRAEAREAQEKKDREDKIKVAEQKKIAEQRKAAEAARKEQEEERWRAQNIEYLNKLRAEKEKAEKEQKIAEQKKAAETARKEQAEERWRAQNLEILTKLRAEKEKAEKEQSILRDIERGDKEAAERRRREKLKEDLEQMKRDKARQKEQEAAERAAVAMREAEEEKRREERKKQQNEANLDEFFRRMLDKRERSQTSRRQVITQLPIKPSIKIPKGRLFRFQEEERLRIEERKHRDEEEKEELKALRSAILALRDPSEIETVAHLYTDKLVAHKQRKEQEREQDGHKRATTAGQPNRTQTATTEPQDTAVKPLAEDGLVMTHLERFAPSLFLDLRVAQETQRRQQGKRPLSALRAFFRVLDDSRNKSELRSTVPNIVGSVELAGSSSLARGGMFFMDPPSREGPRQNLFSSTDGGASKYFLDPQLKF